MSCRRRALWRERLIAHLEELLEQVCTQVDVIVRRPVMVRPSTATGAQRTTATRKCTVDHSAAVPTSATAAHSKRGCGGGPARSSDAAATAVASMLELPQPMAVPGAENGRASATKRAAADATHATAAAAPICARAPRSEARASSHAGAAGARPVAAGRAVAGWAWERVRGERWTGGDAGVCCCCCGCAGCARSRCWWEGSLLLQLLLLLLVRGRLVLRVLLVVLVL
jgi:hypothetical protein